MKKDSIKTRGYNFLKRNFGDNVFSIFNYFILGFCALVTIFPLWNVIMTSLVEIGEFNTRALILWPKKITFAAYSYLLFHSKDISNSLMVTVLLTIVGTIFSLLLTTALSYGLSKKYLPGRGFLLTIFIIPMFFSGGLIPFYLLIKNLGLMNNFLVLFITSGVNVFYFLVIKSFFSQLSPELDESAKIDGANDIRIFISIILPLSMPVLATFFLFYAVGYWNSWWNSMLFIQNPKLYTLQYVLRRMVVIDSEVSFSSALTQQARESGLYLFEQGLRMATVTIATVPIICVYPFLQKYFVKGIMIGSVKG